MMLGAFIFVTCVKGLISTSTGVCKNNEGINYCCMGFELKDTECVPCPAGRFGKNCSLSCPFGYYGLFCKDICDCNPGVLCLPDTGCLHFDANPNSTSSNETLSNGKVNSTGNTTVVMLLSLFITTTILVLLAMFFIRRLNICADTVKLLPQICTTQENSDNIENITERDGLGASQVNRSGRHQCTLATEENTYGDINDEASNDYNLLELRLRDVSCMSADLDRLENQGEYVSLNHEGSR